MSKQEMLEAMLFQVERHKKTAQDLYNNGHYDFCLFVWHLIIEKLLKATVVAKDKDYLFTHKLSNLATYSGLTLTDVQVSELQEITTFNIESRYDNIKSAFYQKATQEYTDRWVKICKQYYDLLMHHVKA